VAIKVVHVSDVSDRLGSEEELGRLVVLEHPDIAETVTLELFPDELKGLENTERFVRLEWTPPGARKAEVLTVPQAQFDAIAEDGDMKAILVTAIAAEHERRAKRQQAGRSPAGGGRRAKINYATLEHAGKPHRGRITDAEKELVQGNLDKVNKRLRDSGTREIDPNDPDMKQRYGL
jgi:hypothetical protein